jgi:hypothetical protein
MREATNLLEHISSFLVYDNYANKKIRNNLILTSEVKIM